MTPGEKSGGLPSRFLTAWKELNHDGTTETTEKQRRSVVVQFFEEHFM